MTLQSSGTISIANINTELGLSSTAARSLNEASSRTLSGIASGSISMSDFYGKSAEVILDTQTVTAATASITGGDPKSPTTVVSYGYAVEISGSSLTDGTSNLYGGATINGIYWDDYVGVVFRVAGDRADSGWSKMKITHSYTNTVTTFLRTANSYYIHDSARSEWAWSSSNIFSNITSGQNSYVITFIQ